jgi:hypothetical protein
LKFACVYAAFLVSSTLEDEGASWLVFCYGGYKMVTLPGAGEIQPSFLGMPSMMISLQESGLNK